MKNLNTSEVKNVLELVVLMTRLKKPATQPHLEDRRPMMIVSDALKLMELCEKLQKVLVQRINTGKVDARMQARIEKSIKDILKLYKIKQFELGGDPRGCPIKVKWDTEDPYPTDFGGGEMYCVPQLSALLEEEDDTY